MEDYNKIIESLGVKFIKCANIKVAQTVAIQNLYEVENRLMFIHSGEFFAENGEVLAKEGDILFLPGGKMLNVNYGERDPLIKVSNDDFITNKSKYFANRPLNELNSTKEPAFSYVSFEAKVFDSVNFFGSLDIPPFLLSGEKLQKALFTILQESDTTEPGRERMIKLETEKLVIEVVRYIVRKGLFVEQFATNSTYFKDPRLIDIFGYIRENLGGDLSNKKLAEVANVSEDYVGQYFKMLTGINPQDYIEYQRMEEAVALLRTSKKSIRDIGKEVGYKDTAYFCRRFKMMFGIPAGKMRRRESLINV